MVGCTGGATTGAMFCVGALVHGALLYRLISSGFVVTGYISRSWTCKM